MMKLRKETKGAVKWARNRVLEAVYWLNAGLEAIKLLQEAKGWPELEEAKQLIESVRDTLKKEVERLERFMKGERRR